MTQAQLWPVKVSTPADLDERYTTRETLDWCKRTAGVDAFDMDAAACDEAHCAPKWYSIREDGLKHPWNGRVWCNPPFSDIGPWVRKAWREQKRCEVISMLLPATRTEQPWWQEHVEPYRDQSHTTRFLKTYFLPGRTKFGFPGNREAVGVGSPPFTCVLLVWR